MAINKSSLIVVEGDLLLDATIVTSLAILLCSAGVTQMPKMLGHKIRVMATKIMAIEAMVVAIVQVLGRPVVRPMLWMPMSSRGIQLMSLRGINQGYLVTISIRLIRFN